MSLMQKALNLFLLAATLICGVSCNKEADASVGFETDQYYVLTGHTIQVGYTLQPQSVEATSLVWSSSDESVATVTGGFVTGVSEGTATVTARIGKSSASAKVTVSDIEVTAFSVPSTLEVKPGGTVVIPVTSIEPEYANATNINWSLVDAPNMESFSIMAVENDKVLVQCHDDAENGFKCQVFGSNKSRTVQKYVTVSVVDRPLERLALSSTSLSIPRTETATLTWSTIPSNTTDNLDIVWSTSSQDVISIEGSGKTVTLNALKEGSSTVSVRDRISGKTASCNVTVTYKRIIDAEHCRIGFYSNATEVIKNQLYKVSGNVSGSTFTIVPYAQSEYYYVGLDDGYGLSRELDVNVSIGGGMYPECRYIINTPCRAYAVMKNNQTGYITVSIPNGSSATLNFRTQVSSISMEKAVNGSFSCYTKNVTTSPVSGCTFTITRPTGDSNDKYQFCLNSGSSPVNAGGQLNDHIYGPYSLSASWPDYACASWPSKYIDMHCVITVNKYVSAGTYVFTPGSAYSDLPSFTVIIK